MPLRIFLVLYVGMISSVMASNISFHPITDDADSGISSDNIYTHAIDFGSDTPSANINGVVFQRIFNSTTGTSALLGTGSSSTSSSHGGSGDADSFLNGASFASMEDLMEDFTFGDDTTLIQLTGLTSGSNYQLRLYHRVWGGSAGNRHQNIGFDTDGVGSSISEAEDTATFLEDDARSPDPGFATYSQVYALTYNYALAANVTTLSIYIDKQDVGTYHLYGLTNIKVSGPLGLGKLTPSDNSIYYQNLSDNLILVFDDDNIVTGTGNIVIYNSDNSLFESIDVTSSQISIEANEVQINPTQDFIINQSYYILVDAGTFEDGDGVTFAGISDNTTWNFSNTLQFQPISNDEDSGIDPRELYTHAIDFGSSAVAVINGVTFQSNFGDPTGTSATIGTGSTNMPSTHAGNDNAAPYLNGASAASIEDLMKDMKYNSANTQITLTGLTPGVNYQIRLYNRAWSASAEDRSQDIGFETNGVGTTIADAELTSSFSEDDASQAEVFFEDWHQVYALRYNYVLSPGVTQLVIYINRTGTGTYHFYGLINQERRVPGTIIKLD
jgi:hypothetical protein